MLWCYDNAIAADLSRSIDPDSSADTVVKVMTPEGIIGIAAAIREDNIKFPLVCLVRNQETPVDTQRFNYARTHRGIPATYDSASNTVYLEKSLPIELGYTLYVLTTNTVDMDEIVRELMFKYNSMYFITMDLPYESDRRTRFGVQLDASSISTDSASFDYQSSGTLYQTKMTLRCEGAVLLSYTPKHMERFQYGGTKPE